MRGTGSRSRRVPPSRAVWPAPLLVRSGNVTVGLSHERCERSEYREYETRGVRGAQRPRSNMTTQTFDWVSQDFLADPYPHYKALRERDPIHYNAARDSSPLTRY